MTSYLPLLPPLLINPIHLQLGKGNQVLIMSDIVYSSANLKAFTGAVMFVNNGQLGRKYLSPERLRTAGTYDCTTRTNLLLSNAPCSKYLSFF
jgi:hypothetical protein